MTLGHVPKSSPPRQHRPYGTWSYWLLPFPHLMAPFVARFGSRPCRAELIGFRCFFSPARPPREKGWCGGIWGPYCRENEVRGPITWAWSWSFVGLLWMFGVASVCCVFVSGRFRGGMPGITPGLLGPTEDSSASKSECPSPKKGAQASLARKKCPKPHMAFGDFLPYQCSRDILPRAVMNKTP